MKCRLAKPPWRSAEGCSFLSHMSRRAGAGQWSPAHQGRAQSLLDSSACGSGPELRCAGRNPRCEPLFGKELLQGELCPSDSPWKQLEHSWMLGKGSTLSSLECAAEEGTRLTQIHQITQSLTKHCSKSQNFTRSIKPTSLLPTDTQPRIRVHRDRTAAAQAEALPWLPQHCPSPVLGTQPGHGSCRQKMPQTNSSNPKSQSLQLWKGDGHS